jgi:hypothetical protein
VQQSKPDACPGAFGSQPSFDPDAALIGLPLVAAVSPEACDHIVRLRIAAQFRGKIGRVNVTGVRRVIADALGLEQQLWEIAASETGRRGKLEIPYAFRYLALGSLWHPDAHTGGSAFALCLRCGVYCTGSGHLCRDAASR